MASSEPGALVSIRSLVGVLSFPCGCCGSRTRLGTGGCCGKEDLCLLVLSSPSVRISVMVLQP